MSEAVARASSNVALAKYWGKRDAVLNLPATGSISLTLAGLSTTARVRFDGSLVRDRVILNGKIDTGPEAQRIGGFIDLLRESQRDRRRAAIEIETNFPVAAGLASSASTFAALAAAAARALDMRLDAERLSVLARRGSGSAARSIFGGYVEWLRGERPDGADSHARQIADAGHWPLGVVVAITAEGPKPTGSRRGMEKAAQSSPLYPAWLASHDADLAAVREGITRRDIEQVGAAAEHNCLKMHAVSMAAQPPLLYWTPATLAVVQRVWKMRAEGLSAYFTIDAGPQVKVICPLAQRADVAEITGNVPGVLRVLLSEPGSGVEIVEPR